LQVITEEAFAVNAWIGLTMAVFAVAAVVAAYLTSM
jgi:hypothetical protein